MKIIGLLLTVIGLLGLSGAQGHSEIHRRAGKPATTAGASGPTQQARLLATYGKLPLSFEANQGQTDPEVKFLSRGSGYTLFLTSNEAVLALRKASQRPRNPNSKMESPYLSPDCSSAHEACGRKRRTTRAGPGGTAREEQLLYRQ